MSSRTTLPSLMHSTVPWVSGRYLFDDVVARGQVAFVHDDLGRVELLRDERARDGFFLVLGHGLEKRHLVQEVLVLLELLAADLFHDLLSRAYRPESLAVDGPEEAVLVAEDRGGARGVVEERELAEGGFFPELFFFDAADFEAGGAFVDDEEAAGLFAFAEDVVAFFDGAEEHLRDGVFAG